MSFWHELTKHLQTGEPAFVGIVADHTRHSPGTRGAKMFVRPDGTQFGTIGGGAMEAQLLARADSWSGAQTQVLQHRADAPEDERSGLICAGKQTMLYFRAEPKHARVYKDFADSTLADTEMELIIEAGRPRIEPCAVGDNPPVELRVGEVYAEHAINHYRAAIIGGGHCGLALSRVLAGLGYHVTIFDERADVFTFSENEAAHVRRHVPSYTEAAPQLRFPELTHVIVMTSDLHGDVRGLRGCRGIRFPYIGVMGSAAKIDKIKRTLLDDGASRDFVDRLYAPIGLAMTSNTPDEIAISVAAQLLRERETLFAWSRPSPI